MTKNNILLLIQNEDLVLKLKKMSNITFLFPIECFTVGFNKTFKVEDINIPSYIFVNRILDNKGIEDFKKLISKLPDNIKGIVFDDIGVLNVLLESNLDITKILFLNHFNCNYESINIYLDYIDSVVISPDLTVEETREILAKASKPLVVHTFEHVNIMYSRRSLITNYNNYFKENAGLISDLEESISNVKFKIIENEYGTVIYTKEPFNGLEYLNDDNILFNLINTVFLSDEEVLKILKGDILNYNYKYLSEFKTIYKLKEDKND